MSYDSWIIAHARVSSKKHKRLKLDDIMSFFQQLATLVAAGVPLLQAIELTAQQSESLKLQRVLEEIGASIEAGNSFFAAAANYPEVFEHAWIEMIRTGEVTGKMSYVLVELNKQVRDSRDTRRKVSGALMYPMVLLCVASLAITAMLWFVVPTFTKMFDEMGAELPQITQMVVNLSDFVVSYGHFMVAGVILIAFAFRRYMATEKGRRTVGGLMLVAPMLGEMSVQMMMYRFASSLALLLKSGVPMLETMETLRGIFGHTPIYRDALAHVQFRIASGHPLAASLEETGLFTNMIIGTVRTGEETGQLATVMEQIAPYYKEKMEAMITRLSKMLEPIIIVGMGTGVAFMMLSIYMPMFEMSGKVK
ncbi:type II secretion system F family protein [Singulisphaera acidiphila]|uniref:General secretion pathway protein F n=1 Tax=Singulisphaera acidiphila (strain ATCC BAA-1392 / DSM 18658 / VKM B-2454 / MOB10) TaxID=886293 RepID=L0DMU9_SINAD|nr:type II secretion system F family protein [Singulisphaera acidiphila]AGA30577.1 type II secretory pathway, component PulF [Singulisphaera acidiphila DSM 18658]